MAIVSVADTFSRPDSSSLGVTPTGGKAWARLAGTAGVAGGLASLSSALAVVDVEVQDFDVRATVSSGGFVAFRVQDASNYWRVRYVGVQVETSRDPIYGTEYEWRADYGGTVTGGHHPAGGGSHNFSTYRLMWGGGTDPTPATTLSVSHSHDGGASAIHSLSKLQAYRTGNSRQTITGYATTSRTDHYVYVETVRAGAVSTLHTSLLPADTVAPVRLGAVSRLSGTVAVQANQSQVYATTSSVFGSATRVGIGAVGAATADTFTVTPLNLPPSAPTELVPNSTGPAVDTSRGVTFSWRHNDPDPQSRYTMRFRPVGTSLWSTADSLTTAQSRTFPVGTLSPGEWEWELETYDSTGLKSPTSARATFTAAEPPGLPTITTPSGDVTHGGTFMVVEWTGAEPFTAFQVRSLLDSDLGVTLHDSGTVTGSVGSYRVPFPVNGRVERVQVRTQSNGLWSGWASRTVTLSYTPPAPPSHVLDPSGPWLRVIIRNGNPTGSQPAVISNDLFRRRAGSSDPVGRLVATDLPYDGEWLDPHVGHRDPWEYAPLAVGSNGTTALGPWVAVEALPVTPDDTTSDVWATGADTWGTGSTDWGAVGLFTDPAGITDSVTAEIAVDRVAAVTDAVGVTDAATAAANAYLRGVNHAGGEFAETVGTGVYDTDWHYDKQATFDYVAGRGHKLVRLPFRWERVQPTRGAALDATLLGHLTDAVARIGAAGMSVILDMHNYGRRYEGGVELVLGDQITEAELADVWGRLATAFASNATVVGYGIQNEPHTLPKGSTLTGAELIANPGFETDLSGWVADGSTIARSTTVFRSGVASMQITSSGAADAKANITPNVAVTGGATYALGYHARGTASSAGLNAFVAVDWFDSGGAYISSDFVGYRALADGTQHQHLEQVTAPATATAGKAIVGFQATAAGQVAYADDVTFAAGTVHGGALLWESASQACVDAIRVNDTATPVYVGGYDYSPAARWTSLHPEPWITDSAGKTVYEAHYYFDRDNSGKYVNTYADEDADAVARGYTSLANRATSEVANFIDWCAAKGVKGFIGEVGWPNTGDTASWNAVGEAVYDAFDAAKLPVTYWAAGEWWGGTYILQIYTGDPHNATTSISATVESHPST